MYNFSDNHAAHLAVATIELHDFLDAEAERVATLFDHLAIRIMSLATKYTGYMLVYQIQREVEQFPKLVGKRTYEALTATGKLSAGKSVRALKRSLPSAKYDFEMKEAVGGSVLQAIIKPFRKAGQVIASIQSRIADMLIEPIKISVLERIILGGASAINRMMNNVQRMVNPQRIADTLARDISDGKDRRYQLKSLQNELSLPKSVAKRFVRTEGIRVATETNLAAYEQLGDLTIGYMIHAVLDEVTRPEHRARNGTIYYKYPEAGQKGINEMPRPPIEQDGTIAYNCRCYLQPVFDSLDEVDRSKFDMVNPAIIVYSDWWSKATDRKKRIAVGVRRYNYVTGKYGDNAGYEYFVKTSGELMSLDSLKAETQADIDDRIKANRDQFRQARERRSAVLATGGV